MSSFPHEYKDFQALAEAAFHDWTPAAEIIYKRLTIGNSGAVVLKVDIRNDPNRVLPTGQYVLKLSRHSPWHDQVGEAEAHTRAQARAPSFSDQHVPKLIRSFDLPSPDVDVGGYATLYEIAGLSLDRHVAVDGKAEDGFSEVCDRICRDLLDSWIDQEPRIDKTPATFLDDWLGYRIVPEDNAPLFAFTTDAMGDEIAAVVSGEAIVNPIEFYRLAKKEAWTERSCLSGLLHGDLHGGNILVHRQEPASEPYWIIDFALSKEGPAGYDHAYLEVAQILAKLPSPEASVLFSALRELEGERVARNFPQGTAWLLSCLSRMRSAVKQWQGDTQKRRGDDVSRQFLLARIAAGLNWANKPLVEEQRRLALYYAGWYARQFLVEFEPDTWDRVSRSSASIRIATVARAKDSEIEDQLWTRLLIAVEGFSARKGRFVLVSEGLGGRKELESIGQLPWSAVIDLDPDSDASGLHRHAAPVLERRRGLHTFSNIDTIIDPVRRGTTVNFARATAWMMAAGWNLKREVVGTFDEWRYNSLPQIRSLIEQLDRSISPEPLHVIVVPGATMDIGRPLQRVARIVREFEELTRGRSQTVLLGPQELPDSGNLTRIPLAVGSFLHRLAGTYGAGVRSELPRIPGADGEWKTVPVELLRIMEENFTVLHSALLDEKDVEPVVAGGFWRGSPPSWPDLQQGLDVPRAIANDLCNELRARLEESRNYTVVLYHQPGAGGTTAALRAAWDLREEFPVAVLRQSSDALAVRLESLFHLAQKPVLLVAEASDLTETNREDLYRDLSHRNARVVLLYVRRAFRPVKDEHSFKIFDPLVAVEATEFFRTYSGQTVSPERLKQLREITDLGNFVDYRRAFFYGLVTFEREFTGIGDYVKDHVRGLRGKRRDALAYIAVITIYSNRGLHEVLLRRLLGVSDNSAIDLSELMGAGPERLITTRPGRQLRILHQVLAEEVLNNIGGGSGKDWRLDLKDLCEDLIRDLVRVSGSESQTVSELFRELFVQRDAGVEGTEDRGDFSPLIEHLDEIDIPQRLDAFTEKQKSSSLRIFDDSALLPRN